MYITLLLIRNPNQEFLKSGLLSSLLFCRAYSTIGVHLFTLLQVLKRRWPCGNISHFTKSCSSTSASVNQPRMSIIGDLAYATFATRVAKKYNIHLRAVEAVVGLFEEGNTVPFICRYRRQQTGDIAPNDMYGLNSSVEAFKSMIKVRNLKMNKLKEDGKLTAALKASFMVCTTRDEVDELWEPFKDKSSATHASRARELPGIEALAEAIYMNQPVTLPPNVLLEFSNAVAENDKCSKKKSSYSLFDALQYVLSDLFFHTVEHRNNARSCLGKHMFLSVSMKPSAKQLTGVNSANLGGKYADYVGFKRNIHHCAAHQLLAIRRGKDENVLVTKMTLSEVADRHVSYLDRFLLLVLQGLQVKSSVGSLSVSATTQQNAEKKLDSFLRSFSTGSVCTQSVPTDIRQVIMTLSLQYSVKHSFLPSLMREVQKNCFEEADVEAIAAFRKNLKRLLLVPPVASYARQYGATVNTICAIDPGFAHGHKVAILSLSNSNFSSKKEIKRPKNSSSTAEKLMSPSSSRSGDLSSGDGCLVATYKLHYSGGSNGEGKAKSRNVDAEKQLVDLCKHHNVDIIVVGDGTGCAQAVEMIENSFHSEVENLPAATSSTSTTSSSKRKRVEDSTGAGEAVHWTVVSEAGASVYSASKAASDEFPSTDISFLGAVSIGRRLLDPLCELVKISPESLGVGMYQHDINAKRLTDALTLVVHDCVNTVGVDLNTASFALLKFISGLSDSQAKKIIAYRQSKATSNKLSSGGIGRIDELKDISGIGDVTFRNAAGFLRISGGGEKLDETCIHPEQYEMARLFLRTLQHCTQNRCMTSDDIGSSSLMNALLELNLDTTVLKMHAVCTEDVKSSITKGHVDELRHWLSMRRIPLEIVDKNVIEPRNGVSDVLTGDGLQNDIRVILGGCPPILRDAASSSESVRRGSTTLVEGQLLQGTVKNIATFGAFVDVRGSTGLLHKSKIVVSKSNQTVRSLGDLAVGQVLSVKILTIDSVRGRMSLAL